MFHRSKEWLKLSTLTEANWTARWDKSSTTAVIVDISMNIWITSDNDCVVFKTRLAKNSDTLDKNAEWGLGVAVVWAALFCRLDKEQGLRMIDHLIWGFGLIKRLES